LTALWISLNRSERKALEELDNAANELNVSRQVIIKILIRQALDQHYLALRNTRLPSGDGTALNRQHRTLPVRLRRKCVGR
jgi:hypothetical protein